MLRKDGKRWLETPLTKDIEFLARLQVQNRIQVPVEIRQQFKLEPGTFFQVKASSADSYDNEKFYAKMKPDGRITIPWEVVWTLKIKPSNMLRITLYAEEQ